MATILENPVRTSLGSSPPRRGRSRLWGRVGFFLALAGLGVGGFLARGHLAALVAGDKQDDALYQTQKVQRGLLRVTVTEDGNVESGSNIDVKCQVEGGSQILWIIPEGTVVKKGAELVKLDSSAIEEQVTTQRIAYEKARSALIRAEEDYAVKTIAVKEYIEGTFVKELQTADANIVIASENLKSAQNTFEHSERMFRKGYINQLQLDQNRFAVQRAQLDLETHQTARKVLLEYTKAKMLRELESARDAANADLQAQKAATELEKSKLDRLEEQLKRCVIVAPQDGMVLYANDRNGSWRGNNATIIEEGAMVREFQTIIRLPELTQMQVRVLVHESKVEDVRPGMPCNIRIRDRQLRGTVISVSSQPEAGNWFASSVKEYATNVKIEGDGTEAGIKPGMTAEVEIVIAEVPGALVVPLTGVVEIEGKHVCFVRGPKGYESRDVVVGLSNEKFLEIKDGLNVGDEVILNPRSTIPEARAVAHTRSFGRGGDKEAGAAAPAGSEEDKKKKAEDKSLARSDDAKGPAIGGPGAASAAVKEPAPANLPPSAEKKAARKGSFNLMSFDKNKDGKLSEDEAPEQMRPMFSRLDLNKDGSIDAKEIAELRKMMQQRQAAGGLGGAPPAGP